MNPTREELLFALALTKPAAERAAWLDRECLDDPALRQRLEALLAAHEQTGAPLGTGASSFAKASKDQSEEGSPEQVRSTVKAEPGDAPDEPVGQTLGRYKLLEKVGEGGCGVVYVAEQTEPVRRRVALKVIKLGMDTKAVVARFEAERQALAMMDHPNIAKVFDAGSTETGRPFFVMELVRGIRITDYCDQNHLSTGGRLDLFIKVCQAIQHAHQKGIIHRDIKPSNILVTLHDGAPVPKVIDFGIAKATEGRLTEATVYTQLHQFIGTPAYMSPEQAEMTALDVDTRSDIYSLGVLLYELLAGRPPFDPKELMAAGIDAMRKTIREQEPMRPSTRLAALKAEELTTTAKRRSCEAPKLIRLLKGDLDWIVMKCLEKDRTRRYETANGLGADLLRHLQNEPVSARPPGNLYRFQKLVRRNKLAFSAAAAVAGALLVGLGVSTWMFALERKARQRAVGAEHEQSRLRREAEQARANEAAQRENATRKSSQLAESLSQEEQQKLNEILIKEGPAKGLPYLARALRQNPDNYRAAYRLLSYLSFRNVARLDSQKKYEGKVRDTCYRGQDPLLLTTKGDRDVWLWDYRMEQPLAGPLTHSEAVGFVTFNASGQKFLAAVPRDNTLEVWSTANTAGPLCRVACPRAYGAVFSLDETKLATESLAEGGDPRSPAFQVWDVRTGKALTKPVSYEGADFNVSYGFTRDGEHVVIQEFAGTWSVLDIATGKLGAKRVRGRYGPPQAGDSEAPPEMVTRNWIGGKGPAATPVELLLPTSVVVENRADAARAPVAVEQESLSPDGQTLLAALSDGTVGLWDVGPHTSIASLIPAPLQAPPGNYRFALRKPYMELNADGRTLLTADFAGLARVWDVATCRPLTGPLSETATFDRARLSPDGHRVVVAQTNGWLRLWDAATGQALSAPFRDGPSPGSSKAKGGLEWLWFSPDGRRLAAGWRHGIAQVWDAVEGKLVFETEAHRGPVTLMVFSPDSRWLATIGADRTARVWDAATGAPRIAPIKQEDDITSCEFGPDGMSLATGSKDKTARLWSLTTGQALLPPLQHAGPVIDVTFGANGDLVTFCQSPGSNQQDARLWDPKTGALKQSIHAGDQFGPRQLTMSRDGRFLLVIASDGARLWDATADTPLTEAVHIPAVPNASQGDSYSWSGDGHALAVPDQGEARIWSFPRVSGPAPEWLPRLAEALTGQRLTAQGLVEPVSPGEFLTLRTKILADGKDDVYVRWARWFLADRATRTISPFSRVTVDAYISACIAANTVPSLQEAMTLDPGNVKALAAFLKLTGAGLLNDEGDRGLSRFSDEQRKLMRQANARHAQAQADRVLAAMPDNSTAWYVKALALSRLERGEEAVAALARANPEEVGPGYWASKAAIEAGLGRNAEAYQSLTKAIEVAKTKAPQQVSTYYLQRSRLLRGENRPADANADASRAKGIPPRDPAAKPNLVDLSQAYTGSLQDLGGPGDMLDAFSELPPGLHTLGGTDWDIRGLLHKPQYGAAFRPFGARGPLATIPVNLRCRRLHFLQGAANALQPRPGQLVGQYTVHYADQHTQEIPVCAGVHIWDWYYYDFEAVPTEAPMVWVGLGERARSVQSFARLFKMSWTNPLPDVEIRSIDVSYDAAGNGPIPFLAALTADVGDAGGPAGSPTALQSEQTVVQQCLKTLAEAIARNPGYWPFVGAAATILEQQNRPGEAVNLLSRALAKPEIIAAPGLRYWPLAEHQAKLLERLSRTNEALACLSQVVTNAEKGNGLETNVMASALLDRAALLRRMIQPVAAQGDWLRAKRIPARDPSASPSLLDLSPWFNAALTDSRIPGDNQANTLGEMPNGTQQFAGTPFDARGMIQLSSGRLKRSAPGFPEAINGVKVGRPARKLHFLHGNIWTVPDGTQVGAIMVHHAGGEKDLIPIVYGENVRDWWDLPADGKGVSAAELAWRGSNPAALAAGSSLRVYKLTWVNPRPDALIETLDYFSAMTDAAPFLIAVTTEE